MATIARKSDGRRIFTDQFKRRQIDRLRRGDLTVTELGRKLGIARSLLQRWKRLVPERARVARAVGGRVKPARELRADECIRELQLLVGKQTVELELIRAELDALRQRARSRGVTRRGPLRQEGSTK